MQGRPSSLPEAEHVRRSFGSERIDRYDVLLILIEVSKSTVHKELNDLCHTQSASIRAATSPACHQHSWRVNLQLCGEKCEVVR